MKDPTFFFVESSFAWGVNATRNLCLCLFLEDVLTDMMHLVCFAEERKRNALDSMVGFADARNGFLSVRWVLHSLKFVV